MERTDPNNAAAWVMVDEYTYDTVGRVRTHTDAGLYTRTFDYDDFDRLRTVSHPDTTTEQYEYSRLDLSAVKDRAGRWTRTFFNPRRQPIAQLTPDGRTTKYE